MSGAPNSLGNYRLIKLLGSGNFGVVYRAENLGTKGIIALKIVRSTASEMAEQVLQEAHNIQVVSNRYTVKINTAFNLQEGGEFLSLIDMPLIGGGTIERLYNTDQLSIRDILKCMRHILIGLSGIHAAGIIHKDIKPGNILIDGQNFVLGDFGLADEANTVPLTALAYLRHHPPELNREHSLFDSTILPSEKYDIYAAGMTLFRLLIKKSEYEIPQGKYDAWCKNPKGKTLPEFCGIPRYIPRKIKTIIQKSTSLDRNSRYDTAHEMKQAIDRLRIETNWSFPPKLPKWQSVTESNKQHCVSLAPKKGKVEFRYTINGRKPNGFQVFLGDGQAASKAMCDFISTNMLK